MTAPGALPTFVVIGAQKCGTTALHAYLARHPDIGMSSPKELDFFRAEGSWSNGVEWYRRHFDPAKPARGESSPNYTSFPHWRGVPERMAQVVPDARLVYLVRDPLDRIGAQWVHNWARHQERHQLGRALKRRTSTYVERSRYMLQLDQFLPHYPAERILVLDQADLRRDRDATLERVFAFVGADPAYRHQSFTKQVHATAEKRRLSDRGAAVEQRVLRSRAGGLVKRLPVGRLERLLGRGEIETPDVAAVLPARARRLLHEDADRLREFTGQPFGSWQV